MGLFDSWSVKDYNIHLSSANLTPGQMLSGNVVFTTSSEMSFRNISLKIMGREHTHIAVRKSSGSGKNRSSHTAHYYGFRNFFKIHITLMGMPKRSGSDWQGTLAPGTYNFPFAVRLPPDALPSMSAESGQDYGRVEYLVKTKIDIPFGADSTKSVPFFVSTAMPVGQLNTVQPFSAQPVRVLRQCCCCCDRGYTSVAYSVDKNILVFAPGNVLNGTLQVNNADSKEETKRVDISVDRTTTFTAAGYTRIAKTIISSTAVNTNLAANQASEETFNFSLPLTPSQTGAPHPHSFRGEYVSHTYMMTVSSGGDVLAQLTMLGTTNVDTTNTAPPVSTDVVMGRTVPKGGCQYPRFIYAAPPGGSAQVPPQKENAGPFPGNSNIGPIPY